jgi:hypothetical protein
VPLQKAFVNHDYQFENISFVTCPELSAIDENTTYVVDPGEGCALFEDREDRVAIAQLSDSGTVYSIFQDKLCSLFTLKPYISSLSRKDLFVEQLPEKDFCETYIVKYE